MSQASAALLDQFEEACAEWGRSLSDAAYDRKEAIREQIESLESAAPVDGWKLVPVEPTEEILAAGEDAWCRHNHGSPYTKEMPDIWRSMVAAAPTATPAGPAQKEE